MNVIDKPVIPQDQLQSLRSGRKAEGVGADPFALPRDFHGYRFVYFTISPRARGLSLGVNFNPDKLCDFDCVYCEVDRSNANPARALNCRVMGEELAHAFHLVSSGELCRQSPYSELPVELLSLRHLTLSGDGEPTLAPNFLEGVETVIHQRAILAESYIPIVLLTNGSGLDLKEVQTGIELFSNRDQIWIKLDAGTNGYMREVNRPAVPIERILENILATSKKRPVKIQSLFTALDNRPPSDDEIMAYAERLRDLREQGAKITEVQIYSATRPARNSHCSHLALKQLFEISKIVRSISELKVEVY